MRLDTHERKKISSFGHSAKADVTFFTGMEMETPPLCQEARTHEASQHRGLDDNLRVLDVPFALDHPQLQLRRAGLPSSPSLGCRTGKADRAVVSGAERGEG